MRFRKWELGIGHWGLGIGNWALGIGDLTYILHQCQKPGFFSWKHEYLVVHSARNRVSLGLLRLLQDVRFKEL